MEEGPVVNRSSQLQYLPILVGIFGSLVAGFQGLSVLGRLLTLVWLRDLGDSIPDVEPMPITGSAYLRAAGYASVNIVLAAVCIAAIAVTVRAAHRGSPRTAWACLGVVAVIGLLTFTGHTWIGESV